MGPRTRHRRGVLRVGLFAFVLALLATAGAGAQETSLRLVGPDGEGARVDVVRHRGYAAVSTVALERTGWSLETRQRTVWARLGEDAVLVLHPGNPFFTWNDDVGQLARAPYFFGERLYVPLQLLTHVLPRRLEEEYAAEPEGPTLTVLRSERWTPGSRGRQEAARPEPEDRTAVVVIDPGHGGKDVGAQGPGGMVEKDIALGVARELAEILAGDDGIEVHLTRTDDEFVPLWERGDRATRWKGDRPGIFISLHANASSRSRSIRGFETYFLSEARTEHERRVAALENAPLEMEEPGAEGGGGNPDLSFILTDLRNRDHQRWSSLLAELVQDELDPVHPGPNRGVKQGPFAVITNALMPAVLVELGFITNGSEARLLSQDRFQRDAARSLAEAIREFFRRYPPGGAITAGGSP